MKKLVLMAALVALVGCGRNANSTFSIVSGPTSVKSGDGDGHDHAEPSREKMMLAHAGKHHAWLTAHLSAKDGNELDILFETEEDAPKPVALPVASFKATIKRDGDEKEYDVTFDPAPANERPKGEAAGTCSHYVAKTPFIKADDLLTVVAVVDIDGKPRKPTWKRFVPSKNAHHMD